MFPKLNHQVLNLIKRVPYQQELAVAMLVGTLLLVGSRSRSKQSGGKKTKKADGITNFRFGQDFIFGIELKCNSEYT